jgi:hypothetical protein
MTYPYDDAAYKALCDRALYDDDVALLGKLVELQDHIFEAERRLWFVLLNAADVKDGDDNLRKWLLENGQDTLASEVAQARQMVDEADKEFPLERRDN